jgi:Tfp pilus assembly protein PilF
LPAHSGTGEGSEGAVEAPSDGLGAWAAATAALVFGLHPLRVESVAWVTERRDVLSLCFALLAVWAYLRAADDVTGTRRRWLAASLAAFAGSLLAKQLTMTLPIVLLILDGYPLRRRALREKIPFACLGLCGALVALWAIRTAAITPWEQYGAPERFAMTMFSLAFYVSRTVLPAGLSPLYELPKIVDPWAPRFVLATIVTLGLTGSAIALRRRAPWFTAAWTAYVVMLMPIAGPVHAGWELAHDRYSYLACLPWALLAGAGVGVLQQAWRRGRTTRSAFAAAATAVVLVLGLWGYLAVQQIRVWRDSLTLWQAAVGLDPACVTCRGKLGQAFLDAGHFDAAARELTRAIALQPERPTAHNTLGSLLYQTGRYAEAAREWSVAARLGPRYAEPLNNLGVLHARFGDFDEAARFFEDALRIQPEYPEAQGNLARARARAFP